MRKKEKIKKIIKSYKKKKKKQRKDNMAKTSAVQRNLKRIKMAKRYQK